LNRCFFSLSDRHAPSWVIVFTVLSRRRKLRFFKERRQWPGITG